MQSSTLALSARLSAALVRFLILIAAAGVSGTLYAAPPTGSVEAYPSTITAGQTVLLTLAFKGAAYVDGSPGIGRVSPVGTVAASPTTNTTYTFTAAALSGETYTTTAAVTVLPAGPFCRGPRPGCPYLEQLGQQGQAAGNKGDYYLNADSRHTDIDSYELAQVQRVANWTYLATDPTKVIIGNGSANIDTIGAPGFTRYRFLGDPIGAATGYDEYLHGNTYWFPAIGDYRLTDTLHAMAPFINTTVGVSGSEMDEMEKYFLTSGIFQPATKAKLIATGMLMPTMEMISRRTRVASDAEYLSAKAHPTAFDDSDNVLAMMQMANAITPDTIPPMVQIKALDDNYTEVAGKDFFDNNPVQRLFDTPVSIARIWRGFGYHKHIRVTAAGSTDLKNRPLNYHWFIVRGDPAKVKLTPVSGDPAAIDIDLDYHPEALYTDSSPGNLGKQLLSSLVVIGCAVDNGIYYSAPAFVTSYTFPGEIRRYNATTHQIEEVDYQVRQPIDKLSFDRLWTRDVFVYDSNRTLQGWWRYRNSDATAFTPEGYQAVAMDSSGRITQAVKVTYFVANSGLGRALDWQTTGDPFPYTGNAVLTPPAAFPIVATPTATPPGGQLWDDGSARVTLQTATPGATIRYDEGWSIPSNASILYTGPIPIKGASHLAIRAFKQGMTDSGSNDYDFTLREMPPTMSPAGGTFSNPVTVALSTVSAGAEIHYTIDGTTPTSSSPLYTGPFTLSRSAIVQAIAIKQFCIDSPVTLVSYNIQSSGGSASAGFLGTDTTTQGSWKGVYGTEGVRLPNADSTPLPATVTVDPAAKIWEWTRSSSEARALQYGTGTQRIASVWYSGTSFFFDISIPDNSVHQLSVYAMDYDSYAGGRRQTFTLKDAATLAVLDQRKLTDFQQGVYLRWKVGGHVLLQVDSDNPNSNVVINGLFFDPVPTAPASFASATFVKLDTTTQGSWKGMYGGDSAAIHGDSVVYPSYATVQISGASEWTWGPDPTQDLRGLQKVLSAGRIGSVWFASGTFTIDIAPKDTAAHTLALYAVDWDGYSGGRNQTIEVHDAGNGNLLDSRTLTNFGSGAWVVWSIQGHVQVKVINKNPNSNAVVNGLFFGPPSAPPGGGGSTVVFKSQDDTTQGNWKTLYGADGRAIFGNDVSFPSYANVNIANAQTFIWYADTQDARAQQKSVGTGRIASTWFAGDNFTIDINLTDGNTHQIAFYAMDIDQWNGPRSETIEVRDTSNNLLDSRSLTNFQNGRYLVWDIQGHVILKVINTKPGSNALMNALFFGGKPAQ